MGWVVRMNRWIQDSGGGQWGPTPNQQAPIDRMNEQQQFQQANWDANTFMPDTQVAPPAEQAANYDWRSQRLYQEAKNRYFQDALGSNSQALSMLGQYRPGGAAGQAANIMQNRGAMQLNIANSLERPDMFANKRDAEAKAAAKAAEKAGQMALLGGVLQAGATVAGAAMGGPAGAMIGNAAGGAANAGLQAQAGSGGSGGLMGASVGVGGKGGGAAVPMQPLPSGEKAGGLMGASVGVGGGGGGGASSPAKLGSEQQANATPLASPEGQAAFSSMRVATLDYDFMDKAMQTVHYYQQPYRDWSVAGRA